MKLIIKQVKDKEAELKISRVFNQLFKSIPNIIAEEKKVANK